MFNEYIYIKHNHTLRRDGIVNRKKIDKGQEKKEINEEIHTDIEMKRDR